MTEPQTQEPAPTRNAGRGWSIAGIVCGVIAVLIIPILFGPLGIIFGIVGYRKGDQKVGRIAIVVAAVGLVLGIIVGALLLNASGVNAP
jgi:hypothetical protein